MKIRICSLLFIFFFTPVVFAYELSTHAAITLNAFLQSKLATDSQALKDLGIDGSPDLGIDYFDLSGTVVSTRSSDFFEGRIIDKFVAGRSSIKGWLMRGVIREDDVPYFAGDNPQDDPYGSIFRVFSHFYDPINNIPLTVGGIHPGSVFGDPNEPAPGWAIGTQNIFSTPILPDANRRNHFTVFDAREAMYRALTGQDAQGNKFVAVSQTERNKYWATTFRALGDVVHLLQDMAQPQHTRNEVHCGRSYNFPTIPGCGHKSVYENYIDARAKVESFVVVNFFGGNPVRTQAQPLTYTGYDIPSFSDYASFYTTREDNIFARRGVADYSNRGFFTAGKNVGSLDYASPGPGPYGTVKLTQDWNGNAFPSNAGVLQVVGPVTDALTLDSPTVSLSTFGMWDQFLLSSHGLSPSYTLTKPNYDDMASLLIPRAVAYSAGLINYFFRGKMEISLPPDGVYSLIDGTETGFSKVKLGLTNASPPGEGMTGGTLVAVAKFHRNTCYLNDLSDALNLNADLNCRSKDVEIVVSEPIPSVTLGNSPTQFPFDFSKNPIPKSVTDLYIQVVYRGKLGSEADAVAVATKDISEPTYLFYHNDSDYIHIAGHVYTRPQVNANPSLLALVQPPDCVIASSPPTLRAACLQPITLNQDWAAGGSAISLYTVSDSPVRSYTRVVLLTDVGTGPSLTDKTHRCLPDSAAIRPVKNQLDLTARIFNHSKITFWRGSYGLNHYSCLISGDHSAPGTPDDRDNVIAPRTDGAATPTAVQILF